MAKPKSRKRIKVLAAVPGSGYCNAPTGPKQERQVHKLAAFTPILPPVIDMINLLSGPDGDAFRRWVIE